MHSDLRSTVVEAITLSHRLAVQADILVDQSFVQDFQAPPHCSGLPVVAIVHGISICVPHNDDFQRPIDNRHLGHFPEQIGRCAKSRLHSAVAGTHLFVDKHASVSELVNRRKNCRARIAVC